MKIKNKLLIRLVLAFIAGASLASLTPAETTWADDAPRQVNPLDEFNSQQSNDPFSSRNDSSLGMMDLIRRVTTNTRSWDDYTTDQNESLNSAAAQFRARQRQLIQNQQQPTTPSNGTTVPQ